MTREELLNHIQEAIKTEESAIAIYSKHLAAIVTQSGLPAANISEIKKTLEILVTANENHKNQLTSLVKQIQGETIDVY